MRFGVAQPVHPVPRPAFPELRRAQVTIHQPLVGIGTFVSDNPPNSYSAQERRRLLTEAAAEFVAVARQLDVDDDTALETVGELLAEPRET